MIKSTITEVKKENEYPVLKTNGRGLVVLFTGPETGSVIVSSEEWPIGQWLKGGWLEQNFTVFKGIITLENI